MIDQKNNVPVIKSISPFYQAILAFLLILIADGIIVSTSSQPKAQLFTQIWTNCIAKVLFYIVANCLLSLRTTTNAKYVRDSIFAFIILSAAGIFASQLISQKSMDESGSFRWLFVVLATGYMIFLAIINTMKFLLSWAKEQDGNLRGENNQ